MTRKERIDAVLDELTPYGFTFRTLQMPYIWDINVLNTGQVIRVSGKKIDITFSFIINAVITKNGIKYYKQGEEIEDIISYLKVSKMIYTERDINEYLPF